MWGRGVNSWAHHYARNRYWIASSAVAVRISGMAGCLGGLELGRGLSRRDRGGSMSPFWMLKAIGQETKRDWRVLHVGCAEGGRSKWFISSGCDVTGIDIKSYSNDYSERGLKFLQTSLEDYRPVQGFNVVVAMYVMPFVRCTWDV